MKKQSVIAARFVIEQRLVLDLLLNLVRQVTSETVRQAMIGHADEASGKRYSSASVAEMREASTKVVALVRGAR